MGKLNKQQLHKRAYEWQKLKDLIKAKEIAIVAQVEETDKLRIINAKLRTRLAKEKRLRENGGLHLQNVSQQSELFNNFSEWYGTLSDHERDEFSTVGALEHYLFKIIK